MNLRIFVPAILCVFLPLAPLSAQETATSPEQKLASLGLTLPNTTPPIANYVPFVRSGSLAFLAGHIPFGADGKVIAGKLGRDATVEEAQAAARQATLGLLATLNRELGDLSRVKRIVRVGGFINATGDFKAHSQVLNGCSDLLVAVFGNKGRHARAAVGVASLPLDAMVEIEMIVEIE